MEVSDEDVERMKNMMTPDMLKSMQNMDLGSMVPP